MRFTLALPRRSPTPPLLVALATALIACDPVAPPGPSAVSVDARATLSEAADLAQTQLVRQRVTAEGIREHLRAFQAAADANGGARAAGTSGFLASAQYVHDLMIARGYDVRVQEFSFFFEGDVTAPTLVRTTPAPRTFVLGSDFSAMAYSGSGTVSGLVVAVDLVIPPGVGGSSTSGCEPADFAGFPAGAIALLQRGTCEFRDKVENALAAGAAAAIIFNEGNTADRMGLFSGTLHSPAVGIPVLQTSFAVGFDLSAMPGSEVSLSVDRVAETRTSRNLIADSRGGDSSQVIVVGAQLASPLSSPGINWSSGAAVALEVAAHLPPVGRGAGNRVRFVWYGGWGTGLGAEYYAANLTAEERASIVAVLDVPESGSPNFGRLLLDGDRSDTPSSPATSAGSGAIEALFAEYFAAVGLETVPRAVSPSRDRSPFLGLGIPVGGVFAGDDAVKTAAEAALFGGVSGVAFDPCYMLACDSYANVASTPLDELSDAVAHVLLLLSRRDLARAPLAVASGG